MQKSRPEDMSLPDRIAVLERGLKKERDKRKLEAERTDQIADYLDVVMNFMDGWKRRGYIFKKKPLMSKAEVLAVEGLIEEEY